MLTKIHTEHFPYQSITVDTVSVQIEIKVETVSEVVSLTQGTFIQHNSAIMPCEAVMSAAQKHIYRSESAKTRGRLLIIKLSG